MPFTRLTFNKNSWTSPSGPFGKCPGTNNWECNAGFGFEEWYRSPSFQVIKEGVKWQYGYLQCFSNPSTHVAGVYNDFDLYTRFCETGCLGNNGGVAIKGKHPINDIF